MTAATSGARVRPYRLAMVMPLPIHYYTPLMRRLAATDDIDLTVLYCSDAGSGDTYCPEIGGTYRVDLPLLDGYRSTFLPNRAPRPTPFNFWGLVNPGLLGAIRRGRFDGVMVMGWGHVSMFLALAAARITGTPVFMHGDSASLYPLPPVKRWVKDLRVRLVCAAVDAFLVCGALNRQFYLDYGVSPDRMFFTPWAVDNDFFAHASDEARPHRDDERRQLGIDPHATTFVYAGKLTARKRPLDLLVAVYTLAREGRNVALLFAGEGLERERLERYVADHLMTGVRFLGFVAPSRMPRIYAVSDAFVLPSEQDPRGTVTNEAMACGLPIVVSDRVGVWGDGDIVRHGDNGFVYPCGRVDLLTDHLRALAVDPARRLAMSRRSREIIAGWNHGVFVDGLREALGFVGRRADRGAHVDEQPAASA